jgi:hypothetical protein
VGPFALGPDRSSDEHGAPRLADGMMPNDEQLLPVDWKVAHGLGRFRLSIFHAAGVFE